MPTFIATQILRYEIQAESYSDARDVFRAFTNESQFEDDVEFLDGSTEFEEIK